LKEWKNQKIIFLTNTAARTNKEYTNRTTEKAMQKNNRNEKLGSNGNQKVFLDRNNTEGDVNMIVNKPNR
jgi:ribonucleotide monophosphatase NagD (HAD superfamily)